MTLEAAGWRSACRRRRAAVSPPERRLRGGRQRSAAVLSGVAALLLSACAHQVGPLRDRVASWVHDTQFGQAVGTILGDAANVDAAVARDLGTDVVHTVCLVLFQDTEAAAGNLPTPDHRLTTLLAGAYATEARAARDCYDAGATNRSLQRRSAAERRRARRQLELALARVRSITGTPVATTTTTTPGSGGLFG